MDNENLKVVLRTQQIFEQLRNKLDTIDQIHILYERHKALPNSEVMLNYQAPRDLLTHACHRVAKAECETETFHEDSALPEAVLKAATDIVTSVEKFANRERGGI